MHEEVMAAGRSTAMLASHAAPLAGARLSKGNDSNVYRLGDQVAKEYHTLPFGAVQRYVELHDAAVEALPRIGYEAELKIGGARHRLTAQQGIAVDELGVSAGGRPLTLSRYVEAPNLEKIMYRPAAFAKYAQAELVDPVLRAFGSEMNALFWNEYPTRVQDEFHYHLCMLSGLLDRELGVRGLYIGKYNAKLAPAPDEPGVDLTITDIAVYIDRIDYG
jgi:hypothetical protein